MDVDRYGKAAGMESQRTLIEAYISVRYPASAVCGLQLGLQNLVDLYPYSAQNEAAYLVQLLTSHENRHLFEQVVLPEVEHLARYVTGDALPLEAVDSLYMQLSLIAKRRLPLHHWLQGGQDEETAQQLIGAFELLHEVLTLVYAACDEQAFKFWFTTKPPAGTTETSAADYRVEPVVEAYLNFLTRAKMSTPISMMAA